MSVLATMIMRRVLQKNPATAQSSHEKIIHMTMGVSLIFALGSSRLNSIKWTVRTESIFLGSCRDSWRARICQDAFKMPATHFLTQFCCCNKRHPQTCRPMWHPADLLRSCLASKATWFCKGYSSKKERMKHTLMLLIPSLITKGTRKALNFEDVHISFLEV